MAVEISWHKDVHRSIALRTLLAEEDNIFNSHKIRGSEEPILLVWGGAPKSGKDDEAGIFIVSYQDNEENRQEAERLFKEGKYFDSSPSSVSS